MDEEEEDELLIMVLIILLLLLNIIIIMNNNWILVSILTWQYKDAFSKGEYVILVTLSELFAVLFMQLPVLFLVFFTAIYGFQEYQLLNE